ncbi:MAG: NAD(P)-dependent oxidoreductase [bacterium]|nr:NAD(P)-dependent oxidoreductase [bacterium]
MNIFITGGTGFIGRHLAERLKSGGHELLVLSRAPERKEGIRYVTGSLSDIDAWKEKIYEWKPDAIAHLAWEGIPDDSEELAKKNIRMSLDLLELAGQAGCETFLGTGSCLEYGGLKGKVREEDAGTPPNPLYKAKAELYRKGKELAERLGIKFIWARPFYVYGPGQKKGSLIPQLIAKFKKGEELKLQDPDAANDFVYVGDVANALALLLEKNAPAGAYNIGSEHLTSVREIVETVAKTMRIPTPKLPPPSVSHSPFFADTRKIEERAGWKPSTKLEEGIRTMIS